VDSFDKVDEVRAVVELLCAGEIQLDDLIEKDASSVVWSPAMHDHMIMIIRLMAMVFVPVHDDHDMLWDGVIW
jgi:hypothetical protein